MLAHKEVNLAPRPVVGLVLHVRDAERFPRVLVAKAWIFFLSFFLFFFFGGVESASRCFTATENDGGDKRLTELELATASLPQNFDLTTMVYYLVLPPASRHLTDKDMLV